MTESTETRKKRLRPGTTAITETITYIEYRIAMYKMIREIKCNHKDEEN